MMNDKLALEALENKVDNFFNGEGSIWSHTDDNGINEDKGYVTSMVLAACREFNLDVNDPATIIWLTSRLLDIYGTNSNSTTFDLHHDYWLELVALRAREGVQTVPLPDYSKLKGGQEYGEAEEWQSLLNMAIGLMDTHLKETEYNTCKRRVLKMVGAACEICDPNELLPYIHHALDELYSVQEVPSGK